MTKTNAQRREIARLRVQAALLRQEANQLRREANRIQRARVTPGKVVAALAVWVGMTLGIGIALGGPNYQQPAPPLQPIPSPTLTPAPVECPPGTISRLCGGAPPWPQTPATIPPGCSNGGYCPPPTGMNGKPLYPNGLPIPEITTVPMPTPATFTPLRPGEQLA